MRAVLDVNVLIAALLSPSGTPAALIVAWRNGAYELIVSQGLLGELERALTYPKLRRRIPADDASRFVAWLAANATVASDPTPPYVLLSADPDDDYLLALAASTSATLVTGDAHLLALADALPVRSPSAFLETIGV